MRPEDAPARTNAPCGKRLDRKGGEGGGMGLTESQAEARRARSRDTLNGRRRLGLCLMRKAKPL